MPVIPILQGRAGGGGEETGWLKGTGGGGGGGLEKDRATSYTWEHWDCKKIVS